MSRESKPSRLLLIPHVVIVVLDLLKPRDNAFWLGQDSRTKPSTLATLGKQGSCFPFILIYSNYIILCWGSCE